MKENEVLLMSIKTKYTNMIFNGTKEYEFRRKSIGEKNCHKKIYIYSSEEEKAIVGYIIVDKIISGSLKKIKTLPNSQNIDDYFNGCNICYALHISNYYRFLKPIRLIDIKKEYQNFTIPQFYRYIKKEEPIYNILNTCITIDNISNYLSKTKKR